MYGQLIAMHGPGQPQSTPPNFCEISTESCDKREDWEDEAVATARKRKHSPINIARHVVTSSK